jgi:hypothetical protein
MRAPKYLNILFAIGIIFSLQAFNPVQKFIPQTGLDYPIQPEKGELSIIDPEAYITAKNAAKSDNSKQQTNGFIDFVNSIIDGKTSAIRGIYTENEFAFPVVQQPSGNPGFVSTTKNVVTEFGMARGYGVTGIIAHNYLAGSNFFNLKVGEIVQVVYGNGKTQSYSITSIKSYQALSPNSANSAFVDLATSEKISAAQLFKRVYTGSHHLTLQTCIQKGSEDSWGRLFIIAEPV